MNRNVIFQLILVQKNPENISAVCWSFGEIVKLVKRYAAPRSIQKP